MAPPIIVTILDPLLALPAASKSPTAILRAVPAHLFSLQPCSLGHGSLYKSSRMEFRANSHSLTGTKNRFSAYVSPFFSGSLDKAMPSYSYTYFPVYSLSPLNTYDLGQSSKPSSWTKAMVP
jgi:hypothetical protein